MLYPQNGSIANGSRRNWPTLLSAAAVCSEAIVAPRNTPCAHERLSVTSGTFVARRPPKRIASSSTPSGSSQVGAIEGAWSARTVNREFGRSEEHTSELQSRGHLVCRLLLEKKN